MPNPSYLDSIVLAAVGVVAGFWLGGWLGALVGCYCGWTAGTAIANGRLVIQVAGRDRYLVAEGLAESGVMVAGVDHVGADTTAERDRFLHKVAVSLQIPGHRAWHIVASATHLR